MRIVLHEKPHQRGTWAPHGVEGFYLGPALEHYRCYRGWVIKTQRERIVDTVAWHPQNVMMPGASEKEILARVLTELRDTIQASTSNLPQPATALLTTLQDDLSALFPITPPAVALSPIQQLIPHVQDLTRKLQMPAQPRTGAIPPDTGADQRVGSPPPPHKENRGWPALSSPTPTIRTVRP